MAADPAPIRGRWTISHKPAIRTPRTRIPAMSCIDGPECSAVEVVPVPDEAAIERAAKAMQRAEDSHAESYMRWLLEIGLRAALGDGDGS